MRELTGARKAFEEVCPSGWRYAEAVYVKEVDSRDGQWPVVQTAKWWGEHDVRRLLVAAGRAVAPVIGQ